MRRSSRRTGGRRGWIVVALIAGVLASPAVGTPGWVVADQDLVPSRGAATPQPGGGPIAHPTGAKDLVLRVETTGGRVPPQVAVRQVPIFSLYGDGRAISTGPQAAIYPGPALPNLRTSRITEDGVQAILAAARSAGLLDGNHSDRNPNVMDAGTTVFTLHAAGRTTVVSAYALGLGNGEATPAADQAALATLAAFEGRLTDLTWLPLSAVVEPDAEYPIDRLQIVSQPEEPPSGATPVGEGTAQPAVTWPLAEPLSSFGADYPTEASAFMPPFPGARCGVVAGQDAATLLPALRRANEVTLWASGGAVYQLYVRPLLPDETGCPPHTPATPSP